MTRLFVALAVLWCVPLFAASPEIVARIGGKAVLYDKIRCRREAYAQQAREQSLDTLCHKLEQHELDRLVASAMLEKAEHLYAIEPTSEEIDRAIPQDVDVAGIAHRTEVMARAFLEITDGKDSATVQRDILDREHITPSEFAAFRSTFHNRFQAEAYLKQDNVKLLRESIRQQKRQELLLAKLHDYVAHEASRSKEPFESVASRVWQNIVSGPDGVTILDPRFSLLSAKGVLFP